MIKVKENFTIDQDISNWLRAEFPNKSEKVNEFLRENYEKSHDSYQKINEIDKKMELLEEERAAEIFKIERKKKESEILERKKAKDFLKNLQKNELMKNNEISGLRNKIWKIICENDLKLDLKKTNNPDSFILILKKKVPGIISEIDYNWVKAIRLLMSENSGGSKF